MADSLAGKLLVASPLLDDPNFHRSVVLVCAHDGNGALGLILNRPLEVAVSDCLPGWEGPLSLPHIVYQGGPVEPSSAIGLGRSALPPADGWNPVTPELGLVDLDREGWDGVDEIRIYAGYAGWSGEQLEGEIAGEAWFVVDSAPSDPFTPQPELLWQHVLRRQPGELRMFAFYPEDPRAN
jgi:putative transcriptional regulator